MGPYNPSVLELFGANQDSTRALKDEVLDELLTFEVFWGNSGQLLKLKCFGMLCGGLSKTRFWTNSSPLECFGGIPGAGARQSVLGETFTTKTYLKDEVLNELLTFGAGYDPARSITSPL